MTAPREDMVRALIAAAFEGMLPVAARSSGDEVLSAMLTMAHNAVKLSVERGQDLSSVRQAVEGMWTMLPPEAPRA